MTPGTAAFPTTESSHPTPEVCIVGGAGHVGAPLALSFARSGVATLILDTNQAALDQLAGGTLPFMEKDGQNALRSALEQSTLEFTSTPADLAGIPHIVVCIGTPVDRYNNPTTKDLRACLENLLPHLSDDQLLILRSTVAPGVTTHLARFLSGLGRRPDLAFCPERFVQGLGIEELRSFPQLISGLTPRAEERAAELFLRITFKVIRMTIDEAEHAKLFANAFRYVSFAITNEFYMMATAKGLDYRRIREGLREDYPRLRDLATPGFTAGPCLYKDTMQLAATFQNRFDLGHAAVRVNEGLPAFVVNQLKQSHQNLDRLTIGLLGMAFKADNDDTRDSLSYKLKKLLQVEAAEVLTTDPHVTTDPDLISLEDILDRADLLIVSTPHTAYKKLNAGDTPLIDIWQCVEETPLT